MTGTHAGGPGRSLSAADHDRVAAAIRAVETRTAGEVFVVVAAGHGDPWTAAALAATLALAGGFVAAALQPGIAAGSLALGQAAAVALLLLLAAVPAVRRRLIPRGVAAARAGAEARAQFLAHNLHTTAARTGVLIYLSLAARHAEIVADAAADAAVPPGNWQAVIDRLTASVAAGRLAEGLVEAVEACGAALAPAFPPRPGDGNELPDKVVEL